MTFMCSHIHITNRNRKWIIILGISLSTKWDSINTHGPYNDKLLPAGGFLFAKMSQWKPLLIYCHIPYFYEQDHPSLYGLTICLTGYPNHHVLGHKQFMNVISCSATYMSVNRISIASDTGLSLIWTQAIFWTNSVLFSTTNFGEISIKIQNFSLTKMHLKISSAKWRLFCPWGDELIFDTLTNLYHT